MVLVTWKNCQSLDTKKNESERQEASSENGMFAAEMMEVMGNWSDKVWLTVCPVGEGGRRGHWRKVSLGLGGQRVGRRIYMNMES